jgi:hypothetical protein
MNQTHKYAARIDYDFWMVMTKVRRLVARTTSINAMVNEGLRIQARCRTTRSKLQWLICTITEPRLYCALNNSDNRTPAEVFDVTFVEHQQVAEYFDMTMSCQSF